MKRLHLIALSAIAAGSTLLAACAVPSVQAASTTAANTPTQQRVTASTGTIEDRVIGNGTIIANRTVDVSFSGTGTLKTVNVKVGDSVKAGDVIATLDDTDLQLSAQSAWANYLSAQAAYSLTVQGPTSSDLKKAQAAIASANAAYSQLSVGPTDPAIAQAKADVDSAQAALKLAQAAYDKEAARNPGVGATQQGLTLEQDTIAYTKAKAAYDALFVKPTNSALASAASQIQAAKADLAALQPVSQTVMQKKAQTDQAYIQWQQAMKNVGNATLKAPIDGLVTAVNFVPGAAVNAAATGSSGAAVITIADFVQPIFQLNVDEADLGKVKLGQPAVVQLQTYTGKPISATVTFIAPVGTTTSNGITTYQVNLTIPKTANTPNILINMSGTGQVISTQINDAILVPSTALTINTNTKAYSVQILGSDGQTQTVPVKIGAVSGDKTQIVSGVSAGDVLVLPSTTTTRQNGPFGGPG